MSTELNIQATQPPTNLKGLRLVYFIGIGGIGMSALARYFMSVQVAVAGYDKTPTELTRQLEAEGAKIHYKEDINQIPKDADLIVYTPAVPKDHAELQYFRDHSFNVVKRSDVLGAISAETFNICIAGTHGKTTISTMVAHLLRETGFGCNAFLGGISVNYQTNFWSSLQKTAVIEADEYDRSFLKLLPDIAVISAMDADHLDIYGDELTMQDAFIEFAHKVKSNGLLLYKFGLPRIGGLNSVQKYAYSLQNDAADIYAANIQIKDGGYNYQIHTPFGNIENLQLNIGGMHNVENSLVAVSIALSLKIDADKVRTALAQFKGVKRRFEYIISPLLNASPGYAPPVLIDDYAHHPEELRALLKSVRSLFPHRFVTVIFQPHLFSRTKDLAAGFGDALSIADRVILLPVYPARELPVEGVSSRLILDQTETTEKLILEKNELLQWIKIYRDQMDKLTGEVIVMAGAGDIDNMILPVKELLEYKN